MKLTLSALAQSLEGEILRGNPEASVSGFDSLTGAGPEDICFFGNPKYAADFAATRAGAILIPAGIDPAKSGLTLPADSALIAVANPVSAFDQIIQEFAPPKRVLSPGVHPQAAVSDDGVSFDPTKVEISPHAVIEARVTIGDGSRIGPGVVVAEGSTIGKDCWISANVTIGDGSILGDRIIVQPGVVIGGDGFGFELVDGRHQKIEQLGIVRIEDDVEIGASTTIDRARFGETVIGEGTKIDNQVQIAHNVVIGKHCLVVAQVGIAGSTRIGDYATIAAMAGIAGHLQIGDRAIVGGGSRVISNLPGDETYFGYPARPIKEDRREAMQIKKLGRLLQRVKELEAKVGQ